MACISDLSAYENSPRWRRNGIHQYVSIRSEDFRSLHDNDDDRGGPSKLTCIVHSVSVQFNNNEPALDDAAAAAAVGYSN